jgi:hypothetical protein
MIRLLCSACVVILVGCSDESQLTRTVNAVGAGKLREQAIAACSNQFPRSAAVKIHPPWPPAVRAFQPLSVWAEPDGIYLLLDSDAAGERGVFVPRVESETDPICGPKLKHAKLAPGIYWYDRGR